MTRKWVNTISDSLGPQMEYSHISLIQQIETCISHGADFNELNEGNMIIFHEWTK